MLTAHEEQIPSLGARLSWIFLICGLGLLLMGLSSSWNEHAFQKPEPSGLYSYTGQLQRLKYIAPPKSATVVDVVIYSKQNGLQRGYLRYGLHLWEERLKPYIHQSITLVVDKHQQIWSVEAAGKIVLGDVEIGQRLLQMKQGQESVAQIFIYTGIFMVLLWLVFLRKGAMK